MKKTFNNTNATNLEALTEGQLKAIALMQFNDENYFLLDDEDIIHVYEGTEEDARQQFADDIEGTDDPEIDANFIIFCANNLSEVEEIDGSEEKDGYIVLTDEEADEMAANYIKESLWAFNADFIIQHSKLPYDAKEMIEGYQREKCESANETIEALIDDIDDFIADAISADGRGHFMSSYDGNENEETIDGQTFYIYRIN